VARARFPIAQLVAVALAAGAGGCAIPIIGAPTHELGWSRVEPEHGHAPKTLAGRWSDPGQRARAEAEQNPDACYSALERAGVAFSRVPAAQARGVQMPLRLRGPIGGVAVVSREKRPLYAILDCRLALSLLSWAPTLRQAGVTSIEHYSIYRPGARVGGSGHVSGHARGLAIDAARFHLDNGTVLDVLTDWEERDHRPPCPRRPEEAWPSRLLRGVVCEAIHRNLFQIVVTPNRDKAHDNHVHLERKPEVSWTYVR
jgi:hypothetical protein